jgi:hypothetical protein
LLEASEPAILGALATGLRFSDSRRAYGPLTLLGARLVWGPLKPSWPPFLYILERWIEIPLVDVVSASAVPGAFNGYLDVRTTNDRYQFQLGINPLPWARRKRLEEWSTKLNEMITRRATPPPTS